ncbi:hypothetical protein BD410DRAFT_723064 [Rickenella mellea]|uniref:DUF6830 domain-containing protein n=1 Tax=Rickenella mellea TaxID=50990 RepID=A0A4Y7Q5B0_9AGAM|nr:hypothetical protein BD410DRAFT_723064 [Rickenella mellea]
MDDSGGWDNVGPGDGTDFGEDRVQDGELGDADEENDDTESDLDFGPEDLPSEAEQDDLVIDHYAHAACVFGPGQHLFEDKSTDSEARRVNPFYPFASYGEWELADWLERAQIPMTKIDSFFKLHLIRKTNLSFSNARKFRKMVESLPGRPGWRSDEVVVEGGTTKKPLMFRYRDGLECFKYLFANPLFKIHSDYHPRKLWTDERRNPESRVYDEIMTGDLAWDIQEEIPVGETLGLVILGSDKTHLTNHQGDKAAHCVYMTIGNIKKDIRSKASSRAWLLVAQIPVAKFQGSKEEAYVLTRRLYHLCMDMVTKTLKQCSHNPEVMTDAHGFHRLTRTILAAFIADLPEQHVIACVPQNCSPSSMATLKHFGDAKAHPLRLGSATLKRIGAVIKEHHPYLKLLTFRTKCREMGLNGVIKPFWRDWRFADPCQFLTPDALHQWHKFFMDHVADWAITLLGAEEFDKRLSVLQPRTGFRHFLEGISQFSQHSGREQRDLQRVFIAVIAGHPSITAPIMRAFRAVLDFIYIAQYESHSAETLGYLERALAAFHANKQALVRAGVRFHYKIPKLELMQHVARLTRILGVPIQFSSDITERLHITCAKIPYAKGTNKKDYVKQMVRFLEREEKLDHFKSMLEYVGALGDYSLGDDVTVVGHLSGFDRTEGKLRRVRVARVGSDYTTRPVRDIFSSPSTPGNDTTAFHLVNRTTFSKYTIETLSELYRIPDLRAAIGDYFSGQTIEARNGRRISPPNCDLPFDRLNVWDHCRIQLRAIHDESIIKPPTTIQARPPSTERQYGWCNFVLVPQRRDAPVSHVVAQVRMIFCPVLQRSGIVPEPLVYVQYLKPAPLSTGNDGYGSRTHITEDNIEMYKVVYSMRSNGECLGEVIPLNHIWRAVELIPVFGKKCPSSWTFNDSVELAAQLYVNCFAEKQDYQCIY